MRRSWKKFIVQFCATVPRRDERHAIAQAAGDMIHQLNSLGARGPVLQTLALSHLEARVLPTFTLLNLGLQAVLGPGVVRMVQRLKGERAGMRIAIDFSTCDHLQMTAGHYRYTVQLVRGLAEIAGSQDFLLLGSGKEPVAEIRDIFGPGSHWVYRRNIPWTHRGSPYVDELAYARHFSAEPISLLHVVHNLIPLTARCPVIVTKHDLIEEMFPEYEAIRRDRLYRSIVAVVKKLYGSHHLHLTDNGERSQTLLGNWGRAHRRHSSRR